jgi:hypothetical protein
MLNILQLNLQFIILVKNRETYLNIIYIFRVFEIKYILLNYLLYLFIDSFY